MICTCFSSWTQNQHKGFEEQNQDTKRLHHKIEQILKKNDSLLKNLGLVISDSLSQSSSVSSSIFFAHNQNRKFIPASLSKIITASVILDTFPLHQTFTTSFNSYKKVENGILKGPLYIKGGGDPSFVSESLWMLVNHLVRSGLKRVEGPLIVDDSLFQLYRRQKNLWMSSDRSYSSYLSALSFNWNSINVYVRPGEMGQPARVFVDPQNSFIKIKNQTLTKNINSGHQLKVARKVNAFGNTIEVKGFVSPKASEVVSYKNVTQPSLWTGYNALEFLKQRGVHLDQAIVKKGKSPSYSILLAEQQGRTVFQLVQDMLKYSSNFISDMLTIQLSLLEGASQGSIKEGVRYIQQNIEGKGIKDYTFISPSGLSRKNKLKPKDILTFLIHDFNSVNSFEKISSYAIPQGLGSLSKRLDNLDPNAMVRAKTGMINGVIGLSGYVKNNQGQLRAFVFIYNGSSKKQYQAQQLFDDLVVVLSQN